MNKEDKKNIIVSMIAGVVLAIVVSFFAFMCGCSTIPVTKAQQETDQIIKSGVLDDGHTVTIAEKRKIKSVLIEDFNVMRQQSEEIQKKSIELEKSKEWTKIGKWSVGIGIFAAILFILGLVRKILSFFKIIP